MTPKLKVAVVGQFQRGKSTLVNALIGRNVARLGGGVATTSEIGWYHSLEDRSPRPERKGVKTVAVKSEFLEYIDLIDTPGLNNAGTQGEIETDLTLSIMDIADWMLVVLENRQIESDNPKDSGGEPREELFDALTRRKKPFLVIMNCSSRLPQPDAASNVKAALTAESQLRAFRPYSLPGGRPVHLCNIAWACYSMMQPHIEDAKFMGEFGHKENTEHYARLHDTAKIGGYMAAKKIGLGELYQHSGLEPVREYLSGNGLFFDSPMTRMKLHAAFGEWQDELAQTLN